MIPISPNPIGAVAFGSAADLDSIWNQDMEYGAQDIAGRTVGSRHQGIGYIAIQSVTVGSIIREARGALTLTLAEAGRRERCW
jgi:hypothetical protein